MIKGIIFDMDGVITDSNHIHFDNWNQVFRRRFSITLDKEEFASRLGESPKDFTEYFLDKYNIKSGCDEVIAEIMGRYKNIRQVIKLEKGVKQALRKLKKKYMIALATGASKEAAMNVIASFGLNDFFDFVIAGDEVKKAKPEPEIFLKAAAGLGLEPDECVIVEDAKLGIEAAGRAGIKVISIPDDFTKYQDHSMADLRLENISEIDDEVLLKLDGKN